MPGSVLPASSNLGRSRGDFPPPEAKSLSGQPFQIGPHDLGHATNACGFPEFVHRAVAPAPALAECFHRHVEADLVAVLETIRHGVRRAIYPDGNAVKFMFFDRA